MTPNFVMLTTNHLIGKEKISKQLYYLFWKNVNISSRKDSGRRDEIFLFVFVWFWNNGYFLRVWICLPPRNLKLNRNGEKKIVVREKLRHHYERKHHDISWDSECVDLRGGETLICSIFLVGSPKMTRDDKSHGTENRSDRIFNNQS